VATKEYSDLVDLLHTSVEKYATNPVFGVKQDDGIWDWMSYAEFGEAVEKARGGLADLGIERGDRVALISDNRVEWVIVAYGAYSLGATVVPMYEAQLPKEWQYILNDCGAKAVFVANTAIMKEVEDFQSDLPNLAHVIVMDAEGPETGLTFAEFMTRGEQNPVDAISPDPDDVAGFVYTSGTTGNPKGVMLTHRNFASNVTAMREIFPLDPEDRSAAFLPWAHVFGQTVELHYDIATGASMGLTSAKTLMEDLAAIRPTILVAVPTVFNRVYDGLQKMMAAEGGIKKMMFDAAMRNSQKRMDLAKDGKTSWWVDTQHSLYDRLVFSKVRDGFGGRMKYAFSGGAAISTDVAEFISALGMVVYEGYGLTETSPVATANVKGARRVGSVGRAIPQVTVTIDKSVSDEEDLGEIVIAGPNIMKGYYNLPEEDAKVFTDAGAFRTGDLGHIDDDGFLYIRGRIKEQYKLENGKYVVPSPIEEQLQLSGYVTNIMVVGEQRPYNVAVIVPDFEALDKWAAGQDIDTADRDALLHDARVLDLYRGELDAHSAQIKGYERVRAFALEPEEFTPENGMLTPSLKIKRRAVVARYGDDIEALYSSD
jgi:long-chain acyl-CoA synthetase